MNAEQPVIGISRREFMKLGLGAAGALVTAAVPAMNALAVGTGETLPVLHVALVAPDVAAGRAMVDGARRALEITPFSTTTLLTRTHQSAIRAAIKESVENGADVVIALMNPTQAHQLGDFLSAHNALLIVNTAGENAIRPDEQHASIIYNSLGYWQASHTAGAWAANTFGKRGLIAASFTESGYDALYSFTHGAESAGTSLNTLTTHIPNSRVTVDDVITAIHTTRPDFVYAAYSGAQAQQFAAAYRAAGLAVPLIVSPFFGDAPSGAHRFAAWNAGAELFAQLGEDGARLLEYAARTSPANLSGALLTARLQGARGLLIADAATATISTTEAQCSVAACDLCAQFAATSPRTGFMDGYYEII